MEKDNFEIEEQEAEEEEELDPEELELMTQVLYEAGEDDDIISYIRDNIDYLKEISCVIYEYLVNIEIKEPKYQDYYTFTDSYGIAREFIANVCPKYLEAFDKLFKNGSMDVVIDPEKDDEGYVDTIRNNGKIESSVHIPLNHTLDDAYAFIHEFFHTTNSGDLTSVDREMYSEFVSIFYEFVLHDYLKDKNVNQDDNNASIYSRLDNLLDNAYDFNEILEYIYCAFDDLKLDFKEREKKEVEDEYLRIADGLEYMISTALALVKFYEYKHGYIELRHIEQFNERLEYEYDSHSLNYLNFDKLDEEEYSKAVTFINQVLTENKSMKR